MKSSFKDFLQLSEEAASSEHQQPHPFFTTKSNIHTWFKAKGIEKRLYTINEDFSVDVSGTNIVIMSGDLIWHKGKKCALPINFNQCNGPFYIKTKEMTSFRGTPRTLHGNLHGSSNQITSIDYLPERAEYMYLHLTGIKSLTGIDKWVKSVKGISIPEMKMGLLSVFKINDLNLLSPITTANKEMIEACRIVTNYLKEGRQDMISCQEELLDKGLGAFAKL